MPSTMPAESVEDGDIAADHPRERRGYTVLTHALVALVTLAVGLAVGFLATRPSHPGDDSAEAGFLRDMATHHGQAVDMGMIAYANATLPEVRSLGLDIGLTQHGQVNIMQTWLREWGLNPNGSRPPMAWMPDGEESLQDGLMPGMATQEQMEELRRADGKQVDILFLTLMRQHHLGGIHMAQEIVEISDDDDVKWLAQTMVETQQSEMNVLADLLKQAQAA
ncbi:DUF305 domain-containing protein [Actinoplanes utahensis]|nr:DUF305 domain-containing protein [Actinoplanes utahensis]GIF33042.1 DUF305 domain-containing protein [Actinoplanes utahensis]